jgi:hypothetical protein
VTSNVDRAIINAEAARAFSQRNNLPVLRWKRQLPYDFLLAAKTILYDEDERPELFVYFVQGGLSQDLDNVHGNLYFGVANRTACTMHLLAWDDTEDKQKCSKSNSNIYIRSGDCLPTPPDHIIFDIKPQTRIKWPQDLNLAPNSNLSIKDAKVGTQESVAYYAHAVDLVFAITVWKCQGGTFDYVIALLEHTPGSPALTALPQGER